jgi:hypothetical protein
VIKEHVGKFTARMENIMANRKHKGEWNLLVFDDNNHMMMTATTWKLVQIKGISKKKS